MTDARGHRIPARLRAEGAFLQILVDDQEANYPVAVAPIFKQACPKKSNNGAGDRLGRCVEISENTVVVGASHEAGMHWGEWNPE
jgi:hypothetical protein